MDQIDSGAGHALSDDALHQQMKELVQEYMGSDESQKRVRQLINRGSRLTVNIDEVRAFNSSLAQYITRNPISSIRMFEEQLNIAAKMMTEDGGKQNSEKVRAQQDNFPTKVKTYYVTFEGNIGKNYVTPRGLKSHLVNQLVQVQGIVTKMQIVQPKIQTSVHYCEATKKGIVRHYNDKFDLA
jgi:DNA replication licensing factor MCM3